MPINDESVSPMNRTARFGADRRQFARLTKALAHPARIAILQFLARRRSCYCGRIVDELPLSQATVSQHLRVLKSAGLIQGAVAGARVCYCLNRAQLVLAADALTALFRELCGGHAGDECGPPAAAAEKTGGRSRSRA
jgi:hypothetical protein